MNGIILIPFVYPTIFSAMWEIFNAQDKSCPKASGYQAFNVGGLVKSITSFDRLQMLLFLQCLQALVALR